QGGADLIGSNVLDCHPGAARAKLKTLMDERRENVYTTEKNGVKKLVHQSPWYKDGQYAGFMEIILELPNPMKHFVRD
ncbi:MAG: diguanylate cyclase, partial [Acidobacteriota bacterium]